MSQKTIEVVHFGCNCGACNSLHIKGPGGFQAGGTALRLVEALVGRSLKEGERFTVLLQEDLDTNPMSG